MKKKKLKLVIVKWTDARGVNSDWEYISDNVFNTTCDCTSVGYVIEENDKFVKVAPHIGGEKDDDDDMQYCGAMIIPQRCIDSICEIDKNQTG